MFIQGPVYSAHVASKEREDLLSERQESGMPIAEPHECVAPTIETLSQCQKKTLEFMAEF